ncbi:MAG TPA: cytochrome c maturation protein CcmE [Anaerolineales bacterium]|nr:cytochrome c maturation protein CcmE [Anaerolineales bacterium]
MESLGQYEQQPAEKGGNMKFIVGGLVILAAVVYLIVSSTTAGAQYFFTVDELFAKGEEAVDTPARVSGAVLGDTIDYDAETLTLRFTVAHMPADNEILEAEGGLAMALNQAVNDPTRQHLNVVYYGVMPDLLQNEAQAIMTGRLGDDGVFYADELLLKCPTRYDEAAPDQAS